MFGMTKRQFLKKSKKALNETCDSLLLFREINIKENKGAISDDDAFRKVNNIRKEIELVFFEFEKLNPPSECARLKQRILRCLINFQESVNLNWEHLLLSKDGRKSESLEYLKQSQTLLEEFRKEFNDIVYNVDLLLNKK